MNRSHAGVCTPLLQACWTWYLHLLFQSVTLGMLQQEFTVEGFEVGCACGSESASANESASENKSESRPTASGITDRPS